MTAHAHPARSRTPARALSCALRRGLPALALAAGAPALADAPVRAVTLFEAGLAELTRETGVQDTVTLSVPLGDVGDVLKSLLLRGDGIVGGRLSLDGAQPVADAFASLPFPPEAATDLVALLRAVPGLRVRVVDRAYPDGREGTLMGVVEDCPPDGSTGGPCSDTLTILGDDGVIRRHALVPGLDLVILDAAVVADLARGLAALREAASGTTREVTVAIEGEGVRDGALSYVVAAPAWKTSYRALTTEDGAVDLQAWAVIENATGEDWEGVDLTLSSGSPRTLRADLFARTWRGRDLVAPTVGPMVAMEFAADAAMASAPAARAEAMAVPPAPITAATVAEEGALDSRFTLDDPVDLAVGEMLSLPFLSDALDAAHLSVWRGAGVTRAGSPEMVLEIENDLDVRLPAGIMTVSDADGGYVGDADFPLVAPGESRAVPYGLDRRARVEEEASLKTRQVSVRAGAGVLRIAREEVREVSYRVTAPSGEARAVAIDHPLQAGWETTVVSGSDASGEERLEDDGGRWRRVVLSADAEGAVLVMRDVRPMEEVIAIGRLDEAAIVSWRGQAADEETRLYLDRAAGLARAMSAAGTEAARAETDYRALVAEQNRVRGLLASVTDPSEAHDRFLADLLALEDRIGEAAAESEAAREALAEAQAAFAAHLGEA